MRESFDEMPENDEPLYDEGHDQSVPLPVALMIGVALLSAQGDHEANKLQTPFVRAAVAAPSAPASAAKGDPKIVQAENGCVLYIASRSPSCK